MSKVLKINSILVFVIIIVVSIYLGKLLYRNFNNKLNLKTIYFDEDTDTESDSESDTESDTESEQIEITDLITPIPTTVFTGPINDKADMSRNKITDDMINSDEDIEYNSEQ